MGNSIKVNPALLNSAAEKMDTSSGEYKKLYQQLYSEVDAMSAAWQGKDNQAFTNQIKGFEDDFQAMYTLMTQYSTFLKEAAKAYQNLQDEVVSCAQKLTN